ncbi:universal stress protein [Streptomyces telluris]|uniref:Universal stress protein n=1 Tax=Streptomyces telluris TaxID=2720021 RepID=A0A9X2LG60_9ACTN|nr:universal stress protein [Streptomyces telluris]MCQ8770538.1 universal stress protein [Streptomyces telluris]
MDGSPESLAAAHRAAAEANRRGPALRLVHAWILLADQPADVRADRDQNYRAQRIVRAAATAVREDCPGLSVTEDLVAEEPEAALLRAAEESAMVNPEVNCTTRS